VGIHLTPEHALEFKAAHVSFECHGIALDLPGSSCIVLAFGKLQKLAGIAQPGGGAIDLLQLAGQTRAFAAQLLGAVGRVPDAGLLEFAAYFFETFFFAIVLKETPSRRPRAPLGL
jgi:hypothetical protein